MKKVTIILTLFFVFLCESAFAELAGRHGMVYTDTTSRLMIDSDTESGTLYIGLNSYGNCVYSYHPEQGWKKLIRFDCHIRNLIFADGYVFCSIKHPFGRNCDVVVYDTTSGQSETFHPELPVYSLWAASKEELILIPSKGQGVIRFSFVTGRYTRDFQNCQYISITDRGMTTYTEQSGWDFHAFDDQKSYHLSDHDRAYFVTSTPSYWVNARQDRQLDIYLDHEIVYTTVPVENAAIGKRYILWYSEAAPSKTIYVMDMQSLDPSASIRTCEVTTLSSVYIVENYAVMLSRRDLFGFELTFIDLATLEVFTLHR